MPNGRFQCVVQLNALRSKFVISEIPILAIHQV